MPMYAQLHITHIENIVRVIYVLEKVNIEKKKHQGYYKLTIHNQTYSTLQLLQWLQQQF